MEADWCEQKNLLDVVQTPRVWLKDGCMMEHLIKGDAEEDYIQLQNTEMQACMLDSLQRRD